MGMVGGWYILGGIFELLGGLMIAGIVFLAALLVVVVIIARDPRRVFWRDARRRDSRGSHLPIRFFWW